MNEEDIAKCQFLPMNTIRKVVDLLDAPLKLQDKRCKRNLVHLQRINCENETDLRSKTWRNAYQMALRQAIYSHNWNRVVFLLRKSPIWEHSNRRLDVLPLYIRALTVLLMNHPSAKSQLLLNDYLHMVLGCRTEEAKKAVYKCLLSLPDKIYGR